MVSAIIYLVMHPILLVEDDPEIIKLLQLHFNRDMYMLYPVNTISEATERIRRNCFDLAILDIKLPDGNGINFCRDIRKAGILTPVIMLTCNSEESDKVLALEVGADDYVMKPFGILELLARVKAILRRSRTVNNEENCGLRTVVYNDLHIDYEKKKVLFSGKRLELTVKEFDLLWLLSSHPGKTFSRKDLLEKIWGIAFEEYEHTITSHINRLRLKLEPNLTHPKYILTSWGSGYRFAE